MEYKNYIKWKSWNKSDFGNTSLYDYQFFDSIFKYLQFNNVSNLKILEIGFGNGNFLNYCKHKNIDIYGVEINNDLLEVAKLNNFNVFTPDQINSFEESFFHVIVLFDVLEHFDRGFIEKSLIKYYNILEDDGVLIARYPNSDSPFGLQIQNGDVTHVTSIGSGKIKYWMNLAKFEIIYLDSDDKFFNISIGFSRYILKMSKVFLIKIINKMLNFLYSSRVNYMSPNSFLIARAIK